MPILLTYFQNMEVEQQIKELESIIVMCDMTKERCQKMKVHLESTLQPKAKKRTKGLSPEQTIEVLTKRRVYRQRLVDKKKIEAGTKPR